MYQTLLKNLLISAIILSVLAVGEVIAQATPNPPAKRNSPFSPNPKKKVEITPVSQTSDKTKEVQDGGEIVKIKSDQPVNETSQGAASNENTSEPTNSQNGEFESRSIASKTLEIAKKARAVEVSPTEIYKVGYGDILFISLQNAPSKESTYFTVLKDGTIDYPLAGEMVQVLGLTTEQIEDLLKEKVKLYENPQVSVKVREHNSHTYSVLGLVEKSGEKYMKREALPLYVIRAEAVVQSKADQVTIKRGDKTQTLDLKDAKTSDVLIIPSDIVEFGSTENTAVARASQFYFIGGEIISGGRKDYTQGLTLTQAILESGGLKKSNVKKVIVSRTNTEGKVVSTEYDLKAIKEGKAVNPVLEAGDEIVIGN